MPDPATPEPSAPTTVTLREHSFDGIQEYDQRLPRWWLLTLYGAMVFAAGYWAYYQAYDLGISPEQALRDRMEENTALAARRSGVIDDNLLWKMSLEPATLASGRTTFETTCAACHKPDMTGLIGPNLVDREWIHGGSPMEVVKTITEGVLAKGMPAWGPLLGKQKIAEITAYIFSHHQPGEPVVVVPGWTPPGGVPPPAPQ